MSEVVCKLAFLAGMASVTECDRLVDEGEHAHGWRFVSCPGCLSRLLQQDMAKGASVEAIAWAYGIEDREALRAAALSVHPAGDS